MMDFISFARVHGVDIARLNHGDRIFRCATVEHPRSTNGAYFFDGVRGWVQNWESGEPVQWWNDDKVTPWSDQEKKEWAARRSNADAQKLKGQQEAANRAQVLISGATVAEHPYLKERGHGDVKALVLEDGELVIPMRDCMTDKLLGAQTIKLVNNEWEKKMLFGMRAKGAVFRLGSKQAKETYLVEGYSTGLSLDTALRLSRLNASVFVCFSATNLVHVASITSGLRYVFADNDRSETGGKAAQSTGLPFCMSDEVGEDANDLYRRAGVMAVVRKVMEVRRS